MAYRASGYGSYRGRGHPLLRLLLILLLALVLAAALGWFFLQPYLVFSAEGVQLHLPSEEAETLREPDLDPGLVRVTPVQPAETTQPPAESYAILKDAEGLVYFATDHPLATAAEDADALEQAVGIFSVFCDQALVAQRPDTGLATRSAAPWVEEEGRYWSSPTKALPWDYNISLLLAAREELALEEIVLTAAHYPPSGDFSDIPVNNMYQPAQLSAVLELFYQKLTAAWGESETRLSIYVCDEFLLEEAEYRSGLTALLMLAYFDRIWYSEALEAQALARIFDGDAALMAARGVPLHSQEGADAGASAH